MVSRFLVPVYCVLVVISSLVLERASYPLITLLIGGLLLVVYFMEFRHAKLHVLRFALLVALHYFTQLNWVLPVFLLLLGRDCYPIKSLPRMLLLWSLYFVSYTSIRLFYSTINDYAILVSVYDALAFGLTIYLSKFLFKSEQSKELLGTQNRLLSTRDGLTGLHNYDAYHRQVEQLLIGRTPLILIIIDCTDLKSYNNVQGFSEGDRLLKEIAELLKVLFSDAYVISRYGGDEFALAINANNPDERITSVRQLLESEIAKLTGVKITYGYSTYPIDGYTKEELIHAAEKMLFSMKNEMWVKRENHLIRSEKLRVVGELASGMAHEIRNPLTTVKGFLQISRSNQYNIEPWYELIMDEINRMSELTAEFLQFSKPHVVHYKVRPIHPCVHRVISLMESEALRLGHQIIYLPQNPELEMLMDQDKLVQLLMNLVKNSFEAMTEEGTVTIRLYESGQYAVIEVGDTGKGIPEAELAKVFHPFYTTKENGTGLGLSICHKIVQDHGGNMEVESKLMVGTTFRLSLPKAIQSAETGS
ncbi:sensor histidine kinase [Paenibacillus koleovorans]|uniref:sensor histidine kinase n=1 Tax=Paenibacillus koleovorans TaxID=121608 RepID=UPI000FD9E5C9|nr:ATP-binding protein [Paenibacillus koleovorans]